jgi:hypothetical protein
MEAIFDFNGEVRDREKVMRGLKNSSASKVLDGYQIYHNFIRPHEGIANMTPAEKRGIKVEGENKWITIIQNALTESNMSGNNQREYRNTHHQ